MKQETLRALIINRNKGQAKAMTKALGSTSFFFEADVVDDEQEYINNHSHHEYNIVLLDSTQIAENEFERLRAVVDKSPIPVVVFVDDAHKGLSLDVIRHGAVDCVLKRSGYLDALPLIIQKAFEIYSSFQRMHFLDGRLKTTLHDLEKAYKAIDEELEISRKIQVAMIPQHMPDIEGVTISSLFVPSGRVGGDLFDVIAIDEDHVAFLVFDVSGHGVPSALISAMAKMSFATHLQDSVSLVSTFQRVNQEMIKNIPREYYITAFAAILNVQTFSLKYANASHTTPFLYRGTTGRIEMLHTNGLFVGMLEDGLYEEKTVSLHKGDKLFLFTDGLYEIFNPNKEIFGKKRLKAFFQQNTHLSGSALLKTAMTSQEKFLKGQKRVDDITAILLEVEAESRLEKLKTELGFEKDTDVHVESFIHYDEIESEVTNICQEMAANRFHDQDIRKMRMVLYELLTNAVNHGNKHDFTKKVYIGYRVSSEVTRIGILDEGEGYDYNQLPDPTSLEHLAKEGGRGLYITRSYADEIHFNEKGNRVHIVKHNTSAS